MLRLVPTQAGRRSELPNDGHAWYATNVRLRQRPQVQLLNHEV